MKSKHLCMYSMIVLAFAFVGTASAQQQAIRTLDETATLRAAAYSAETDREYPVVRAFLLDPDAERTPAWWAALEEDISLEGISYRKVPVEAMQNVIFFQVNHREEVDLTPSVPTLLDVYFYHRVEGMRIMAMAALYEIGNAESLSLVKRNLYKQRTERVRDFSISALQVYYNHGSYNKGL